MCKVLDRLYKSKAFKNCHEIAKEMIKTTLDDMEAQNFLQDSDYAALLLLVDNLDMYYRMSDKVKADGVSFMGKQGMMVQHPLLSQMARLNAVALRILDGIGGSTVKRRVIQRKALAAAELNPMDALLQKSNEDDDEF